MPRGRGTETNLLGAAMWGKEARPPNRWDWSKKPPKTLRSLPTQKQLCATRESIKAEIESMRLLLGLRYEELLK